jgi:histidinol dehydrogenase
MRVLQGDDDKGRKYVARLAGRMRELFSAELDQRVRKVVADVAKNGDKALVGLVRKHDLKGLSMKSSRLQGRVESGEDVGDDFVKAVELALANLKEFHEPQALKGYALEHESGDLRIRVRPLDSVGVYVPGGAAVYISSLLMAAMPARIAGVPRIAVATPPRAFLSSPQLRYVLDRLDLREVYLMGGAHAVAALAYGTDSVTPVDKIVGPGGRWVAAAKRAVFGEVDVDSIAGPSEVAIVADAHAEPEIVAADMLAQAEHDPDALALLVTPSRALAEKVERRIKARLRALPKASPAHQSMKRWGGIVLVRSLEGAVELVNFIAPEHVELLVEEPLRFLDSVDRAGAVFLGPLSPVVLGDYVVGTNHILPTGGAARFGSPLGVWDFVRRSAVVRVAPHRYRVLARAAAILARYEELPLHAEAVLAGTRAKT